MSTISPSRLLNVETASTHKALVQDNMEILAEEVSKRVATYQSGSPTTIIGPPTSGDRVLNEFWRDALGGEWRCTSAGTPGTWLQIRPAAVTTDPASGTIPTGYVIWNVSEGTLKIHAGSYSWEVVIGGSPTDLVGFFGATPVAQQSGTGETTGFTAGSGTAVNDDSTFTGNIGTTAYRVNDVVKALKLLGFLAE